MKIHRLGETRILPAALFIIIAAGFLYLLKTTWLRWGSFYLGDTGRELWLPGELLKGKLLYKDLFYQYGFFAPYFIAFLYLIFGAKIYTVVFCGISLTILMSLVLYNISRIFLDSIRSSIIILTFLFIFAFNNPDGCGLNNFIIPYSYASTFFILFAAAALLFFLKFIIIRDYKFLFLWSFFMFLVFLCRADMSFTLWLGFILSAVILGKFDKTVHKGKMWWYISMPFLMALASYGLILTAFNAVSIFFHDVFGTIAIFIRTHHLWTFRHAGLTHVRLSSELIIISFLFHLVMFLVFALLAVRFFMIAKKNIYIAYAFAFSCLVLCPICFIVFYHCGGYGFQYRCIPLIIVLGIAVKLYYLFKYRDLAGTLPLLTIGFVSLALLPKMLLRTVPSEQGFYLLSLALVYYFLFFFSLAKKISDKLSGGVMFFNFFIGVFFLLHVTLQWQPSLQRYHEKNLKVTTTKGQIFCFPDKITERVSAAIDYLSKNTPANATLAAIPDTLQLNFFSDRDNPLSHYSFLTPDIFLVKEDELIREFARDKIDYVAISQRLFSEHGYPVFGKDYLVNLSAWIHEHYEVVKLFGPMPFTTHEFGIAILKLKHDG